MHINVHTATLLACLSLLGCGGGGPGWGLKGTIYYQDIEDGSVYKMTLSDA